MSREIRLQARDPGVSCLVQAPAGSGKTELLTQRILGLLAIVDEPGEILALTFTRKAAAEMRRRVMDALNMERPDEPEVSQGGEVSHRMETWLLAQKACQRSRKMGWHLLEHPSRLRIMTLDSLTHMLARQLPLLSGLGDAPVPMEHAIAAYRQAAESALQEAMRDYPADAGRVLLHQDHNAAAVIELLAGMLAKREQWLGAIARHGRDMDGLRQMLEANLARIMVQELRRCDALFPMAGKAVLPALIRFAGENIGDAELQAFRAWPATEAESLRQWQILADFLLVADKPQLRKSVNKRNGFPAGKEHQANKEQMTELLVDLAEIQELADVLHRIRKLPLSASMDDNQWQVLESLFLLLILANRQLQQLFASKGEADFTEIALRAMDALGGHEEAPGDLLMKLDYRISHILVDEFQDTSHLQMDLLQCLTTGWQQGDGRHRTLFMVGDPMQSIYRFRKAEVGLFLNAAANDAGLPAVQALQLERNFRSSPAIVNWVNDAFQSIFPARQDAVSGAVTHAPAEAALTHSGSVTLHLQRGRDDLLEAQTVVHLVQEQLKHSNEKGEAVRIGILARSRKHLHAIMPALDEAGIPYRAIDILPLYARPEIRLLRAMIGALLHPADRLSWAAILRAPCCGLDSSDIHALMGGEDAKNEMVWTLLADDKRLQRLSDDGRARAMHVRRALEPCLALAGRMGLAKLLECAWQRLSMPDLIDNTAEKNVQAALDLVASMEKGGYIDFALLDERLNDLYAAPDTSEAAGRVELLTMHGAKGLQWDTVILPGLGKASGQTDNPLLAFSDVPVSGGASLLMAARAPTRGSDAMYDLVRDIEKSKDDYELQRLLYVACTRAETTLHLLGHVSEKSEKAARSSLLGMLLEKDAGCFGARVIWQDAEAPVSVSERVPLRRMARIPPLSDSASEPERSGEIEYGWAGPEAAPVGTAVHAALQYIGERGIERMDAAAEQDIEKRVRRMLMLEGLSGELLASAHDRAMQAVHNTMASERGRWILSSEHQDAHCEWPLSETVSGRCVHKIIDRSFVDKEGNRWVIDYKTASHEGGDVDDFLASEAERHKDQLQGYVQLLRRLDPSRPVRAALYFPMLDAWHELV